MMATRLTALVDRAEVHSQMIRYLVIKLGIMRPKREPSVWLSLHSRYSFPWQLHRRNQPTSRLAVTKGDLLKD